jgi:EAL domain-containing protein (putative c-di-GMP-specific phosphodiesterase class I)/GGDEF domain-containing protein
MAAESSLVHPSPSQISRLKSERDRFVALAFCWGDLLLELDAEGTIAFAGGATEPLLGRPPGDLVGSRFEDNLAASDRALLRQVLKIAEKRGRTDHLGLRLLGKRGVTPPFSVAGHRLDEFDGHFFLALRLNGGNGETKTVGAVRDQDTGLFDGGPFANVVAERANQLRASGADVRLTLVTMDDFADLRAGLDEASDRALMSTVGACFRANSVDGDTAGRIADGRYGLLHRSDVSVLAFEQELSDVIRKADPEGRGLAVETATVEIGDAAVSEEDMARSLLYVVNRFRQSTGGAFTIKSLSSNLSSLMNEATHSVESFKRMVASRSFNLAFQPIIDVNTGVIHHYEALARFPGAANESPYQQITFAEETGLITDFDLAIVQKAVEWLDRFPRNTNRFPIAINVSGHSVGSERYVSALYAKLRENAWVRDKLLFEITESSRMADLETANTFIQGLRQVGHHVCLDDFGAGAASFQYLSALDVDVVKLDGSAIRNARRGKKGKAFLTALSALCRSLGVETIAEMIEKEDALAFVRDCGVNYVQGFLFGQPSASIKDFDPLPKVELFRSRR